MQNSNDPTVDPITHLKVHNIWSMLFTVVSVAITVLTIIQPMVKQQAQNDPAFIQTEQRVNTIQGQIVTLKDKINECNALATEAKSLVEQGAVKGVSTGSAVKKVQ